MRAGLLRALSLGLAVAAGACSDTFTAPVPEMAAPLMTLTGESLLLAEGDGTVYDFDDVAVPTNGFPCALAGEGYRDLTFVEGTSDVVPEGHLWFCRNLFDATTVSLIQFHGAPGVFEDQVVFASPVDAVEVAAILFTADPPTSVVAYDASGAVLDVAVADGSMLYLPQTLAVSGGGTPIASIGLSAPSGFTFFDAITTFGGASADPTDRDDCKNGGWRDFGFANQGQCVRFVETGEDGRGLLPEQAGSDGARGRP